MSPLIRFVIHVFISNLDPFLDIYRDLQLALSSRVGLFIEKSPISLGPTIFVVPYGVIIIEYGILSAYYNIF